MGGNNRIKIATSKWPKILLDNFHSLAKTIQRFKNSGEHMQIWLDIVDYPHVSELDDFVERWQDAVAEELSMQVSFSEETKAHIAVVQGPPFQVADHVFGDTKNETPFKGDIEERVNSLVTDLLSQIQSHNAAVTDFALEVHVYTYQL